MKCRAPSEVPIREPIDLWGVAAVAAFVGGVLVFDLTTLDVHPLARILNSLAATVVVVLYFARAPRQSDRLDRLVLVAFLLFASTCILSQFPRQSFDTALAALLSVSLLYVAREVLARDAARRIFILGLMTLSGLLTILTAVQWIGPYLEWWALTNWTVLPPLDLRTVVQPWGLRHDMALVLVLLYPAWWVEPVRTPRAAAALVVGVITVALLLLDGSRTIWLAVAIGAASLIAHRITRGEWNPEPRRTAIIGTCIAFALVLLLTTDLGSAFIERAIRLSPVAQRGAMWESLFDAWSTDLVSGYGPGSFPWILQLTGYFDTNSFAPRHSDSALVQLFAEAGLLGALAVLVALAAVVPAVYRGRSRAASFAVITGLAASMTLNPTDLALLTGIGIAWAAFGAPRAPSNRTTRLSQPSRATRAATAAAGLVVVLAFTATLAADVAYWGARVAIDHSAFEEAEADLAFAVNLDPSMALYHRQLGTLQLIEGRPRLAMHSLSRATALNPSDDLAWRTLSLAASKVGDYGASRAALERAVAKQRSDPTNLLLFVEALRTSGEVASANGVLAEVVQAWPLIIAAPGWPEFVEPATTSEVVKLALDRWTSGLPSPEPLHTQPLLLGILAGLDDASLDSELSRISPTLRSGFIAVARCPQNARAALDDASTGDIRTAEYWALRVRIGVFDGQPTRDERRIHQIMTGAAILPTADPPPLNPLHENDALSSSADQWGYGRPPILWPDFEGPPSPWAGFARWHTDPVAAAIESEPACDPEAQASATGPVRSEQPVRS